MIHDIPPGLKGKFKSAVALRKPATTMKAVIVKFMEEYSAGRR